MNGEMNLIPIGIVINSAGPGDKPGQIKASVSRIDISEEYQQGIKGMEQFQYLVVVFGLNRVTEIHIQEKLRSGNTCGIFACRSQFRPNRLGITTCRLLRIKENSIFVQGLDACNGSPVFDLKCPDTSEEDQKVIHESVLLKNPRNDIEYAIRNATPWPLILKAGQLTGLLSAELIAGVLAGMHFMQTLREQQLEVSDFKLHTPANSLMTDGALFVTGITPGCGRLIHKGKNKILEFKSSSLEISYQLKKQIPDFGIKNRQAVIDVREYFLIDCKSE